MIKFIQKEINNFRRKQMENSDIELKKKYNDPEYTKKIVENADMNFMVKK